MARMKNYIPLINRLRKVIDVNNAEKDNILKQIKKLEKQINRIDKKILSYENSLELLIEESRNAAKERKYRGSLFDIPPKQLVAHVLKNHSDSQWISNFLYPDTRNRVYQAVNNVLNSFFDKGLVERKKAGNIIYWKLVKIR
ncbi:MAG: hypothetical protein CR960_01855 [Pasteurellales bacterium]|nr:MAG: hypothetical protein CR960_01855 [Pasteurellales bacterium]